MNRALPKSAPEHAPSRLPSDLPQSTVSEIASWLVGHTLDEVERELIHHTLENCGGDRVLAATVLGLSRPALRRKLTAYAVRGQALPDEPAPAPAPAPEPTLVPAAQESRAVAPVPQADNDRAPKSAVAVQRPEKPRPTDFRLLIGGALAAALILLIGVGLFGETKPGAGFAPPERARIELSVIERPQPFQHRITVPVWNGPQPLRAEPAIVADIAADKRIQSAARAVATPVREAVVPFASEQDTRMELAAASELDARMELAPANSELDTRMELAASDFSQDTRMELAADSEQDTRMELAGISENAAATAPETTGSIGTDATFVAPDDAPQPLARPATVARAKPAPVQRQAPRPRAAPAQAETPAQIVPPFFPFNIFAPRNAQRAGGGTSVPYDCCVNN